MGQFVDVVCHDCRQRFRPSLAKLSEIQINPGVAREIGLFLTLHPGHLCELRGDEWSKSHAFSDEDVLEYEAISPQSVEEADWAKAQQPKAPTP